MTTLHGTIDVDFTDEIYAEYGSTVFSRRRLRKFFAGGFTGRSEGEFLMTVDGRGTAAYVGLDWVSATIDGRNGSFVLVHRATRSLGGESASVAVLPGSATDDLEGLGGTLEITLDSESRHTYTFDYELKEKAG